MSPRASHARDAGTGVGIVGCGVISDVYAAKLSSLPDLRVVACADLAPERARELAAKHRIPLVLEPEKLLRHPDVEIVLNLTIPAVHAQIAGEALAAGKSVYGEKPLALELRHGVRLLEKSRRAGLRIGCAPDTFLGAGIQTCRKLLDDGAIGTPVAANAFFQSPGPERWHPRPHVFYQRGAGPVFDMAPYYLTALVALLGPARRITGSARITHACREITSQPLAGTRMDVEVPTHVAAVIDFHAGPVATLVTSFDVQASRARNIEIFGTEGTLSVPDPNTFGGPVQIRLRGDKEWRDVPLTHANAAQSRGIGLVEMARANRAGRPQRASGELACHVLELMELAIVASDTGRHRNTTTRCERPAPLAPGLPDDVFE
ncbi:MAG: Gfo/Idh/MocA family oxidoreductase [Myxococcota bacterium]